MYIENSHCLDVVIDMMHEQQSVELVYVEIIYLHEFLH